jgi:erythromycin esterase-like protein
MWLRDRERFNDDSGELVSELRERARPLRSADDLDPLLERIGDARYVLLGEASHGTHEYYTWRTEISRRLIREKGFNFIAVEGDWPDCYRVNRYVQGRPGSGESAFQVLHAFDRWPTWMWANREVAHLAEWLRDHNDGLPEERKVGFYGLDVYSLWDSMRSVTEYLDRTDPELAKKARWAYRCFDPYTEDVQEYARSTRWVPTSCEQEVVSALVELRRAAGELQHLDGQPAREAYFNAEQNALVAKNAELYYRTMVQGGSESWNVRDQHMMLTLDRLMDFHGKDAKAIVWEHNTHIGDARATDMARAGMFNVGQLAREQHAAEGVVLVGFGSHRGSVIAGAEWEAPMERMRVPEARPGSWEALMHECGGDRLWLLSDRGLARHWYEVRGHRAIGVVYNPDHEAFGNYVPTVLPQRYDAFLFIDRTHALQPLHLHPHVEHEVPETYPSGV